MILGASVEILSVPAETMEIVVNLDNLCKERISYSGRPCDYNIRCVSNIIYLCICVCIACAVVYL